MPHAATWIEKNLAKINEAINLMKQGRKMSDKKRKEAERLGINVTTAAGSEEMLQLLNDLKAKFEFIGSYPDLVAQATLYDGVSEVDPVGRLLEQAQRDRAEMEEENAMSDEELLEKRNRELAAQEVPSLFQMSGGQMPKMTRKQIERMIDGLKQLSENERTLLKQLVALDNGAEAAVFNSIAMGGAVQLRQGHEKGGLIHMLNRRVETGLTPLEAKLVAIFACFSAAKGEISEIRDGIKYSVDHNGVRAAAAKNSPDSMPVITGFVIDDKGKNAVATGAADSPRTSYALVGLRRDLPVGAALTDVVAWFARFVKTNRDWEAYNWEAYNWEAYMVRAVMELKAIQEGKRGMDWSGSGSTFSMEGERAFIKEAAVADGTYMQAPNGKPTKLTERQWLTVRTKAFKAWFGDWESAAYMAHFREHLVSLLTPDAIGKARITSYETLKQSYDGKVKPMAFIPFEIAGKMGDFVTNNLVYSRDFRIVEHVANHRRELNTNDYEKYVDDLLNAFANPDKVYHDKKPKSYLFADTSKRVFVSVAATPGKGERFITWKTAYRSHELTGSRYHLIWEKGSMESVDAESHDKGPTQKEFPSAQLSDLDSKRTIREVVRNVNPKNVSKVVDENGRIASNKNAPNGKIKKSMSVPKLGVASK